MATSSLLSTPTVWLSPNARWQDTLDARDLDALGDLVPPRALARGEHVYRAGEETEGLYLLSFGVVKIVTPVDGRALAVAGPNDLFGTFACRVPQATEAVAVSNARVLFVSCDVYEEALVRSPRLGVLVAKALAEQVRALHGQLERATRPAPSRLASTLLDLARRFGRDADDGRVDLDVDVRQDDLAALAGTSRVSATQALGAWRALGLVEGTRGRYRVNTVGLSALLNVLEEERLG